MMADVPFSCPCVSDLKGHDRASRIAFICALLLRKVTARTARNGSEYLSVEVGDRTGTFTITSFSDSATFSLFRNAAEGAILRVSGNTGYYQDRFSPTVSSVEIISEDEAASENLIERLIEVSPEDPDTLWHELQRYATKIRSDELRSTVDRILVENEDAIRTCPAAISMHHAYRSGLLEHTVHLCRAGRALLPLYPEIDGDLALSGLILHDIGKILEYTGARTPRKSRAGILQGHVVLGYRLVRKAAIMSHLDPDRRERLEHIVLSHQGELEWGAAAMAATPEAVFVSMLDNLDARMGMVQRALRSSPEGAEFSEYLAGLKTSLMVTPVPPFRTTRDTDSPKDSAPDP